MINPSLPYLYAQIPKFIFVFFLFFIPANVNSEVNLTEILDENSEKIIKEINKLNKEFSSSDGDKIIILIHENEKLRERLLEIGQKLKSLKQDSNMQFDKNSETREIYDYAKNIFNTLVCEKYLLGEFSDLHLNEFNVRC